MSAHRGRPVRGPGPRQRPRDTDRRADYVGSEVLSDSNTRQRDRPSPRDPGTRGQPSPDWVDPVHTGPKRSGDSTPSQTSAGRDGHPTEEGGKSCGVVSITPVTRRRPINQRFPPFHSGFCDGPVVVLLAVAEKVRAQIDTGPGGSGPPHPNRESPWPLFCVKEERSTSLLPAFVRTRTRRRLPLPRRAPAALPSDERAWTLRPRPTRVPRRTLPSSPPLFHVKRSLKHKINLVLSVSYFIKTSLLNHRK